jgi:hypothetical protein
MEGGGISHRLFRDAFHIVSQRLLQHVRDDFLQGHGLALMRNGALTDKQPPVNGKLLLQNEGQRKATYLLTYVRCEASGPGVDVRT